MLTNRDVRQYVMRLTDQWFGITYVQIAVAVFVAILGIVNTLTVSITDRRRELGVLQAVGGLRNQVRGTIWLEALAVGTVGLILGLALGALQLYYSLHISAEDMAELLRVDVAEWKAQLPQFREYLAKFDNLPAELSAQLDALQARLG